MTDTSILNRLRLLLNLAQDTRTPEHEAEVAMTKAMELMRKHNLTMGDAEAQGSTTEGSERKKQDRSGNAFYEWQRQLMAAIGKLNSCWVQIRYEYVPTTRGHSRRAKGYNIIGREANVISCQIMFDYLVNWTENNMPFTNAERLSKSAMSWKLGASARFCERLAAKHEKALKDQEEQRAATGSGLVLREYYSTENDLNTDFVRGLEPGTTAALRMEGARKWEEGRAAREAEWNRALAEESKRLAALTPKQRAAEERKQARDEEKWQRQYERNEARRSRKAAKIDGYAFNQGYQEASKVGLDDQLTGEERKKLG